MTDEQKAKAYDEALKQAESHYKVFSQVGDTMGMKALEASFPELRESEDEKIRKAIEAVIRVYGKTQGEWITGYDMDTLIVHLREAFAYLEKQKEQSEILKDLDEAADKYSQKDKANWNCYNPQADDISYKAFIAGANWQKEQMMSETVEGMVYFAIGDDRFRVKSDEFVSHNIRFGDKVRVIVCKKEDNHE